MIAVILSVGPPYRKRMVRNGIFLILEWLILVPFIVTIVISVLFTTMLVVVPPLWLASLLELTYMSLSFSFLLIAIAVGNFILSWLSERVVFSQIRGALGRISAGRRKKYGGAFVRDKKYKLVEERM